LWFFRIGAEEIAPKIAKEGLLFMLVYQDNQKGYGAIYWIVQGICACYCSHPQIILRIITLLFCFLIPVLFVAVARQYKSYYTEFSLMLWLVMPTAWWFGKVTGPEMFSLFFAMLAIYLALTPKWWGWG